MVEMMLIVLSGSNGIGDVDSGIESGGNGGLRG